MTLPTDKRKSPCSSADSSSIPWCGVQADNVLVDSDGSVMLADLGVAAAPKRAVSMVNLDHEQVMRSTVVGTPCWMAPEVLADAYG
jgi:serine/threonine protein kinase